MYTCKNGQLEMIFFVYICVVVQGMYARENIYFWKQDLVFIFTLLLRVCAHVILGVLAKRLLFYIWDTVIGDPDHY